jgi:hypothetical protein
VYRSIRLGWRDFAQIALILTFVLLLAYADVVFLRYTLSPAHYFPGAVIEGPYGYNGRIPATPVDIDTVASSMAIFPIRKLVACYFIRLEPPLWNPYVAMGTPLAADTTFSVYGPFEFLNLLPDPYWDAAVLVRFWLAAVFTAMFLRELNLKKWSVVAGSAVYMLSGAFTWYPTHIWSNVIVFTPLLLLLIEKLVKEEQHSKFIAITSLVFAFSILGAHIESLILQLILISLYFFFRLYEIRVNVIRKLVAYGASVLLALGLSAFFTLPVLEYLSFSYLGHGANVGTQAQAPCAAITTFIPYFLTLGGEYYNWKIWQLYGEVWNRQGGYVGVCSLYLCSFALFSAWRCDKLTKQRVAFWFAISSVALMKVYGIPLVNWVGYLPVLDHIIFMRYLGGVWTLGFAIMAAFGVDQMTAYPRDRMLAVSSFLAGLGVIIFLAVLNTPFLLRVAVEKLLFQIAPQFVVAFAFLLIMALSSVRLSDDCIGVAATFIITLELLLYLPKALPGEWEITRYWITLIIGLALMPVFWAPPTHMLKTKHPRIALNKGKIVGLFAICGIAMQIAISGLAPMGLPQRYDAFLPPPYIKFLSEESSYSRIYSLDNMLPPNYAGVFGLYHIGIVSAFNVPQFRMFVVNNLDSEKQSTYFLSDLARRGCKGPDPVSQIHLNLKFYSLLGVKYIVSYVTNPNFAPQWFGGNRAIPLGSHEGSLVQTFRALSDNLSSIGVQIGTYNRINHGSVLLTLDSIPYDERYHRVSFLPAEEIVNNGINQFNFDVIEESSNKNFRMSLRFPCANSTNGVAVWTHDLSSNWLTMLNSTIQGHMFIDGKLTMGCVAFQANYSVFPLVYRDTIASIYQNPSVFQRVFVVHRFQVASSAEEAQRIIKNPDFNLREDVVLDASLPESEAKALEQTPKVDDSTAEIMHYEPDKVIIKAYAEHPGLLILTDTYYPGWKAYVDGKPTMIYQADGLVRAVYLSQGEHRVEFIYFPESFKMGLTISVISAITLIMLLMVNKFKLQEMCVRSICRRVKVNNYTLL